MSLEKLYGVAALLPLTAFLHLGVLLCANWWRRRPGPKGRPREKKTKRRVVRDLILAVLGFVVLAVAASEVPYLGEKSLVRAVAAGASVLGTAWLHWTFATMGADFTAQEETFEGQQFHDNGPYKWVRHPAYTGYAWVACAGLLALGTWLAALLAAVGIWLGVRQRAKREEERLAEKWPDQYRQYIARTGRYVPWTQLRRKIGAGEGNDR